MKANRNPFIEGVIVSGDDYCSRDSVEKVIKSRINSGQNIVLIGDRRIGKSSTAHFVIDSDTSLFKVEADLYHVTTSADIAEVIIDSCRRVLVNIWDRNKVTEFFSRISPTLDISESGSVSFGISTKSDEYRKTLNVAFECLEETVKRTNNKLVILLDEFQAIKEVKNSDSILKFMRGKIQKMSRTPFVYVGSIKHEMDYLFRDQSSPFYKQGEIIYFEHIERDPFYSFLKKRFKQKQINFEKETYNYLYDICNGVTGDIQTFCRVSFDCLEKKRTLNFSTFFHIIEIIYKNELKYFKDVMDGRGLTKIQKKMLLYLSPFNGSGDAKIFSKDFQKSIGVKSPGAVTSALNSLKKKEYLYESEDSLFFSNPFFKEWLLDYRLIVNAQVGFLRAGDRLSGTRLDFGFRDRMIREYGNEV